MGGATQKGGRLAVVDRLARRGNSVDLLQKLNNCQKLQRNHSKSHKSNCERPINA
jgi:hypothetical protein